MKKKIISLCLVVALGATAVIGGTLAYFTDTDEETNEFTVGNVQIDLIEDFDKENTILRPGDQKTNAINKDVWIQNVGSEDAWLWYEWYIPAVLDSTDNSTGTNNIVHVNSKGATWDKYWNDAKYSKFQDTKFTGTITADTTWDHDPEVELGLVKEGVTPPSPEGFLRTETIVYDNGTKDDTADDYSITYNVYLVLYKSVVKPQEFTPQAMDQVYLDSKVDFDGTNYTIGGQTINYDFAKGVDIIVKAYGIQAKGFDTVYEAWAAYQAQA